MKQKSGWNLSLATVLKFPVLTAARLAQLDKHRSSEREELVQVPAGPTLRGESVAFVKTSANS